MDKLTHYELELIKLGLLHLYNHYRAIGEQHKKDHVELLSHKIYKLILQTEPTN